MIFGHEATAEEYMAFYQKVSIAFVIARRNDEAIQPELSWLFWVRLDCRAPLRFARNDGCRSLYY